MKLLIGPLQDSVTWYGINYTGTQMTQWDFQNKGKSGWRGKNSFVFKVPLRHLRPSVIYSVPCDRILQRAYFTSNFISFCFAWISGLDWKWGNQDGGAGKIGRVFMAESGLVKVITVDVNHENILSCDNHFKIEITENSVLFLFWFFM